MTHRRLRSLLHALVASVLAVGSSGCGTLLGGVIGGPAPYAGTRLDAQLVASGPFHYQGGCGCEPAPEERASPVLARGLAIADLPFSFAVDTLLLPITLPLSLAP